MKQKDRNEVTCAWCGAELEERSEGYEVVNPGGKVVLVLHLCDGCWKKYQEVKDEAQ